MLDASAELKAMVAAAQAAGEGLKARFAKLSELGVRTKSGPADLVSIADEEAERTSRDILAKARPGYGFLGEEGGAAAEAVRQRVMRTVSQAKVRLADASTRARSAATDAARATDTFVHDNPWKAIAYGAAAGAAVALLASVLMRRD